MFYCNCCGLCCKNVNQSPIYQYLDRGNGICKYFNDHTSLCSIYDHRPVECNVDAMYNPWLTNDNVKKSSNSKDNIGVVSRKFNNAKRSRSNKDFVNDDAYLEKTGVKITNDGKAKACSCH